MYVAGWHIVTLGTVGKTRVRRGRWTATGPALGLSRVPRSGAADHEAPTADDPWLVSGSDGLGAWWPTPDSTTRERVRNLPVDGRLL